MTDFSAALAVFDGHPLVPLADRLLQDLTRLGIPVRIITEETEPGGPGGVDMIVNDDFITVSWVVAHEERLRQAWGADPGPAVYVGDVPVDVREQYRAADVAVGAFYATGVLTAALAGILATLGYHIRSSLPERPFAPYVEVTGRTAAETTVRADSA